MLGHLAPRNGPTPVSIAPDPRELRGPKMVRGIGRHRRDGCFVESDKNVGAVVTDQNQWPLDRKITIFCYNRHPTVPGLGQSPGNISRANL